MAIDLVTLRATMLNQANATKAKAAASKAKLMSDAARKRKAQERLDVKRVKVDAMFLELESEIQAIRAAILDTIADPDVTLDMYSKDASMAKARRALRGVERLLAYKRTLGL